MSQLGSWQSQERPEHAQPQEDPTHDAFAQSNARQGERSPLERETEEQLRMFPEAFATPSRTARLVPQEWAAQNLSHPSHGDDSTPNTRSAEMSPVSRKRSARTVVPGLPRPPTFKRVLSERRDRLYPVDNEKSRSISTDRRLIRRTSCSSPTTAATAAAAAAAAATATATASSPRTPSWSSTPEMRMHNIDRRPSIDSVRNILHNSTKQNMNSRSEAADSGVDGFGLLPPACLDERGDDDGNGSDRNHDDEGSDDEGGMDPVLLRQEVESKWFLNVSMHFRDQSDREKFFLTYAQEPNRWRRVTVTCDYRNAPKDSLESKLRSLYYQRDKSEYIYKVIRDSLPDIDFYPTVTNLRLETRDSLHVHVTEDVNEIISYPAAALLQHNDCPRFAESTVEFDSHLSGFVYKVSVQGQVFIKKEIPGPGSVDEFLYEVNALTAVRGAANVIQIGGLVVDDSGERIKGLLINYAEYGNLADLIGDYKGTGEFSWPRRERWVMQIIQGLSDIHESGFVQGDFTLSNIVVDGRDNAQIIDINRRGCPMGWEPPELLPLIFSGQRIPMLIGVKSDLFQLGMVLWALANEVDEPSAEERPLGFTAKNSGKVPQYFKDTVLDCLSENPRDRPSAKELLVRFPSHNSVRQHLELHRPVGNGGGQRLSAHGRRDGGSVGEINSSTSVNIDNMGHGGHLAHQQYIDPYLPQHEDDLADAVTYGNITPSTERSSNRNRRPVSQVGQPSLPSSLPIARGLSADNLSLLSSTGGGDSSSSEIDRISSSYHGQLGDTSHWQQIYDDGGTRQLVNRASLSIADDESTLTSNDDRFIPSIIATAVGAPPVCQKPSTDSIGSCSRRATPIVRNTLPSSSRHAGDDTDHKTSSARMMKKSETGLRAAPSLAARARSRRELRTDRLSPIRRSPPEAPEPPSHASCNLSDTECLGGRSNYHRRGDRKEKRQEKQDHESTRPRRSSTGEETTSSSFMAINTSVQAGACSVVGSSSNAGLRSPKPVKSGFGLSYPERARQMHQAYSQDTSSQGSQKRNEQNDLQMQTQANLRSAAHDDADNFSFDGLRLLRAERSSDDAPSLPSAPSPLPRQDGWPASSKSVSKPDDDSDDQIGRVSAARRTDRCSEIGAETNQSFLVLSAERDCSSVRENGATKEAATALRSAIDGTLRLPVDRYDRQARTDGLPIINPAPLEATNMQQSKPSQDKLPFHVRAANVMASGSNRNSRSSQYTDRATVLPNLTSFSTESSLEFAPSQQPSRASTLPQDVTKSTDEGLYAAAYDDSSTGLHHSNSLPDMHPASTVAANEECYARNTWIDGLGGMTDQERESSDGVSRNNMRTVRHVAQSISQAAEM